MTKKSKVLLIGMGGVGSIAAYTLEHAGKCEVTVVVRSSYDILTTSGFTIDSLDYGKINGYRPTNVEKNVKDAMSKYGPFDYIVVTTKNIPDVSPVEDILSECYHQDSTIMLLQNGVGIERSIFNKFPKATVLSGVTLICTTLYHDTVKHLGTDVVSFGPFINPNLPKDIQINKCKKFVELYANANNVAKYEEDVKFIRWRKLVYNASKNPACALTNVDAGRMQLFGGNDTIIIPAMKEVITIAKSDGVDLPETIIKEMLNTDSLSYYPPSMLVDLRKGNYTEYQVILGNALDIAKENNIDAPTLTVLHNLMHVVQMKTMETNGRFVLPEQRPTTEENYKIEFK